MPVELRKRKAPAPPPEPPAAKKRSSKVTKAAAKVKEVAATASAKVTGTTANGTGAAKPAADKPVEGDIIDLEGFGGEVQTQDGETTSLKALVDESKAGVVLFTYPKASTPGCTNQACLFRDSYESLTAGGLAIYGLSTDSPKANTAFKEKQKLPYPLLCDPSASLIGAIGMKKTSRGTTRGVFVVDKAGKVLACAPGGPGNTVAVVKKLVEADGDPSAAAEASTTAAAADEESTAKPETEESKEENVVEAADAPVAAAVATDDQKDEKAETGKELNGDAKEDEKAADVEDKKEE